MFMKYKLQPHLKLGSGSDICGEVSFYSSALLSELCFIHVWKGSKICCTDVTVECELRALVNLLQNKDLNSVISRY